MNTFSLTKQSSLIKRLLCALTAFFFLGTSIFPNPSMAQALPQTILNLPIPGSVVSTTAGFNPVLIKGVNLYPDNPLKFDFIIDKGDTAFTDEEFKKESTKLIKYFLSSLTVPEDEMWVNLSPYEKNRIVPQDFGKTEMGRDLLAQDYMLKQLTASLMNPDDKLGGEFWQRVYTKAQEKYGTTDIPMNTFNKIWIVPEKAVVYEHEKGAFVVKSHLKVMLEEDYLALDANKNSTKHGLGNVKVDDLKVVSGVQSAIIKDLLIPEIEKEVNEGKTFTNLRQIYNAVILASWYKQALKESLLGQVYVDQKKTKGVETDDQTINEKIYNQYVESFKKGVYNYIKEDYNPETQEVVNRKYFSGGANLAVHPEIGDQAMLNDANQGDFQKVDVDLATMASNQENGASFVPMGNKLVAQLSQASPKIEKLMKSTIDQLSEPHILKKATIYRYPKLIEFDELKGYFSIYKVKGQGDLLVFRDESDHIKSLFLRVSDQAVQRMTQPMLFVRLNAEVLNDPQYQQKLNELNQNFLNELTFIDEHPEDEISTRDLPKAFKIMPSQSNKQLTSMLENSPLLEWLLQQKEAKETSAGSNFVLLSDSNGRAEYQPQYDLIMADDLSFAHETLHAIYEHRIEDIAMPLTYRPDEQLAKLIIFYKTRGKVLIEEMRKVNVYRSLSAFLDEQAEKILNGNSEAARNYTDDRLIINELVARVIQAIDQQTIMYTNIHYRIDSEDVEAVVAAGFLPEWFSPERIGFTGPLTSTYDVKVVEYLIKTRQNVKVLQLIMKSLKEGYDRMSKKGQTIQEYERGYLEYPRLAALESPDGATLASELNIPSASNTKLADTNSKGGIDLNPTILNTEIKRNGRGVIIPAFRGAVPDLNGMEGFIPNIINVTPITNLQLLLGLDTKSNENPQNPENENEKPMDVSFNLSALPAKEREEVDFALVR